MKRSDPPGRCFARMSALGKPQAARQAEHGHSSRGALRERRSLDKRAGWPCFSGKNNQILRARGIPAPERMGELLRDAGNQVRGLGRRREDIECVGFNLQVWDDAGPEHGK